MTEIFLVKHQVLGVLEPLEGIWACGSEALICKTQDSTVLTVFVDSIHWLPPRKAVLDLWARLRTECKCAQCAG